MHKYTQHNAERHYTEWHYAECRYAEWHYAECHDTNNSPIFQKNTEE